jgi:hypothetical protein
MTERIDDQTTGPVPEPHLDMERDEGLGRLLRLWRAPAVSDALDERVLAGFRRATQKRTWWRRLLTASIPVPVPMAVAALLLILVSVVLVLRRPVSHAPEPQFAVATRTADQRDPAAGTPTSLAGFQPVEDMNVTVVAARSKP